MSQFSKFLSGYVGSEAKDEILRAIKALEANVTDSSADIEKGIDSLKSTVAANGAYIQSLVTKAGAGGISDAEQAKILAEINDLAANLTSQDTPAPAGGTPTPAPVPTPPVTGA